MSGLIKLAAKSALTIEQSIILDSLPLICVFQGGIQCYERQPIQLRTEIGSPY